MLPRRKLAKILFIVLRGIYISSSRAQVAPVDFYDL